MAFLQCACAALTGENCLKKCPFC